MGTETYTLSLGFVNCYLIRGEGTILVDTGTSNHAGTIVRKLDALSIEPTEIALILLTHGHADHTGSAAELRRLTGAPVALHRRENEWLEAGLSVMPRGVGVWGKIMAGMLRVVSPMMSPSPAPVDLALGDEGLSLEPYGISGTVLHTPGHSPGSVSLLLDSGQAFVGDLVMNGLPMRFGPGLPLFADDVEAVRKSVRLLLDKGARRIYPAHGRPFSADALASLL
jgi:glyoxylase-like metal-dependent hydrolase (beta-lactamase superfamily II)